MKRIAITAVILVLLCGLACFAQGFQTITARRRASAAAPVPALIQASGTPNDVQIQNAISVASGYQQTCFSKPTQSGDKVIIMDINNQTSSANSVTTDDGSNTYAVPSGSSEIAGSRQIQFHTASVTTPSQCFKDTYTSSTPINDQLNIFEFNNLGAFDVACAGTVTTGTSLTCGSGMTTTANGDLIIACTNVVTFSSTPTGNVTWTPPSGFTLFNPSGTDWSSCAFEVQTTAGAITPTFAASQAVTRANTVAVSYKAASGGGSIPATIWLADRQSRNDHGFSTAQTATTRTETFYCAGNDPWIMTGQIDTDNISGITDTDSATWTGLTKVDSVADGFEIQWWHITSGTTCTGLKKTVTITYASNPSAKVPLIQFFDVMNSAGYDSSATCGAGSTPCAINNSLASNPPVAFNGAVITPSSASSAHPELLMSYQNQDFNTISGVSPGEFLTDIEDCPGTTSGCAGGGTSTTYAYVGSGLEQDAGIFADYVTSNASVTVVWTPQNTQSQSNGASFSSTIAIKSQ